MQRKQNKVRELVTLAMILHCKGGKHRNKADKRKGNKKNNWREQE